MRTLSHGLVKEHKKTADVMTIRGEARLASVLTLSFMYEQSTSVHVLSIFGLLYSSLFSF